MVKSSLLSSFSVFSVPEKKAFMNGIVIPLCITIITQNLINGLIWVFFVTLIYTFLVKKTENAKTFFLLLRYLSFGFLFLAIFILLINLI